MVVVMRSLVQSFSLQLNFSQLNSKAQCSYTQHSMYQLTAAYQHAVQLTVTPPPTSHAGIAYTTSIGLLLYIFVCPGANALHMPCQCMARCVMSQAEQPESCRCSGLRAMQTPVWQCNSHLAIPSCCFILKIDTMFTLKVSLDTCL